MFSPEVGRDQTLICHLVPVATETDDFFCTMMEPVGYRNGWGRNGKVGKWRQPFTLCVTLM